MNRALAKGIVSDALLLAFGLRRERRAPLDYRPVRSRRGTLDEYRLMALMAATYGHDLHLAAAAAASLEILHPQPLVSLAFDIARRLEAAGLQLEAPDPRLFERPEGSMSVEISRPPAPRTADSIAISDHLLFESRPTGKSILRRVLACFPASTPGKEKGPPEGTAPLGTTLVMSYS